MYLDTYKQLLVVVVLHVTALWLLSVTATYDFTHKSKNPSKHTKRWTSKAIIWVDRFVGLLAAVATFALPYTLEIMDPLPICSLRIVCFFYGCKIVDLAVARASDPPQLLTRSNVQASDLQFLEINTIPRRACYIWLLLTETRYHAFDIATRQKDRQPLSKSWDYMALALIPAAIFIIPSAETKSLSALLLIQNSFEGAHSLLHRHCDDPLFWRPFAATSITSFWSVHWHSGAESFLRSLGYSPMSRLGRRLGLSKDLSRAAGVMAAFTISGIWHGWATAVLSNEPWQVGLRVFSLFVGMGVGCLLENIVRKQPNEVSRVQQLLVWSYAVAHAGWCWRGLQATAKSQWLANL